MSKPNHPSSIERKNLKSDNELMNELLLLDDDDVIKEALQNPSPARNHQLSSSQTDPRVGSMSGDLLLFHQAFSQHQDPLYDGSLISPTQWKYRKFSFDQHAKSLQNPQESTASTVRNTRRPSSTKQVDAETNSTSSSPVDWNVMQPQTATNVTTKQSALAVENPVLDQAPSIHSAISSTSSGLESPIYSKSEVGKIAAHSSPNLMVPGNQYAANMSRGAQPMNTNRSILNAVPESFPATENQLNHFHMQKEMIRRRDQQEKLTILTHQRSPSSHPIQGAARPPVIQPRPLIPNYQNSHHQLNVPTPDSTPRASPFHPVESSGNINVPQQGPQSTNLHSTALSNISGPSQIPISRNQTNERGQESSGKRQKRQRTLTPEQILRREKRLEKNRLAARECRKKKKEYLTDLEYGVRMLAQENSSLWAELAKLRSLVSSDNRSMELPLIERDEAVRSVILEVESKHQFQMQYSNRDAGHDDEDEFSNDEC